MLVTECSECIVLLLFRHDLIEMCTASCFNFEMVVLHYTDGFLEENVFRIN